MVHFRKTMAMEKLTLTLSRRWRGWEEERCEEGKQRQSSHGEYSQVSRLGECERGGSGINRTAGGEEKEQLVAGSSAQLDLTRQARASQVTAISPREGTAGSAGR